MRQHDENTSRARSRLLTEIGQCQQVGRRQDDGSKRNDAPIPVGRLHADGILECPTPKETGKNKEANGKRFD